MNETTTKKPATKKTAEKKVAKKKTAAPKKTAAAKKTTSSKKSSTAKKATAKKTAKNEQTSSKLNITPEERWKMVAVAAYHRAEKRSFASGHELQDWTEAEKEVDKLLLG